MTKDELKGRYDHLYKVMAESKQPEKMMLFGHAEKHMFHELAEAHPEAAEAWLAMLDPVEWHNYLSKEEAEQVTGKLENQDGTHGAHWDADTFKNAVERLGGKLEDKPYYNMWALWATANMIFSDHAQSIAEDMGYRTPKEADGNKMALSCYKKAVEKLKDPDRVSFARWYFRV